MEGVERYKVRLLPHNSKWEEEFLAVKGEIKNCWKKNILDIQHIGSTAIKSICAKPILDVAVRLKSIEKMDINALTDFGYEYCGTRNDSKTYHLFVLRDNSQLSLRHIHCYDKSEQEFDLLVGFRNYLNMHLEAALKYQEIKMRLAEQMPDDRVSYTKAKEEFVKSIVNKL